MMLDTKLLVNSTGLHMVETLRSIEDFPAENIPKLTFAKGASLEDPDGLFNSSLEGNTRRAIDIHEGEQIDASAFTALVLRAVALNSAARAK